MARTIWLAALIALPLPDVASRAAPPRIVRPPQEPREGEVNVPYCGTVTRVTRDSVTIQWMATPGEQPKTFQVSETLAAGKIPKEPRLVPGQVRGYFVMPCYMYRLTDVKVGDWVSIHYASIGGVDICDHICIDRRPDGLIPPLPKEAEDLIDPREHTRNQFKKKGKPVPPDWEKMIADWPYTPYHEMRNAYWEKVAPMPREVKPAIAP